MKPTTCLFISMLFLGANLFAQIPGMTSTQISSSYDGTSLGSNETLAYSGIALGNAVKLRGYVDFIFNYEDLKGDPDGKEQEEYFSTASDVDFLFDMSPVTAELHIALDKDSIGMEQAFGRYSFNQDLHLTFGRQLTVLGYEADEAPGLYAVTNAYYYTGTSTVDYRRNYKDGARLNFNNGQFGLTFGLHDGYWANDDFNSDNIAIDLAASMMIIPGLEAQLGYAHEEVGSDDISQFNAWAAYSPNNLTLAIEYDNFDILGNDYWAFMMLGNYQFVDWMAASLRYSHEDFNDSEADRITLALLFTITDNLFFNVEYSTTEADAGDYDEFYVEGLLTF